MDKPPEAASSCLVPQTFYRPRQPGRLKRVGAKRRPWWSFHLRRKCNEICAIRSGKRAMIMVSRVELDTGAPRLSPGIGA